MSDADVEELLKLPPEKRVRLVELIWGSLTAIPSATLAALAGLGELLVSSTVKDLVGRFGN